MLGRRPILDSPPVWVDNRISLAEVPHAPFRPCVPPRAAPGAVAVLGTVLTVGWFTQPDRFAKGYAPAAAHPLLPPAPRGHPQDLLPVLPLRRHEIPGRGRPQRGDLHGLPQGHPHGPARHPAADPDLQRGRDPALEAGPHPARSRLLRPPPPRERRHRLPDLPRRGPDHDGRSPARWACACPTAWPATGIPTRPCPRTPRSPRRRRTAPPAIARSRCHGSRKNRRQILGSLAALLAAPSCSGAATPWSAPSLPRSKTERSEACPRTDHPPRPFGEAPWMTTVKTRTRPAPPLALPRGTRRDPRGPAGRPRRVPARRLDPADPAQPRGISRRNFLGLVGATAALAATVACDKSGQVLRGALHQAPRGGGARRGQLLRQHLPGGPPLLRGAGEDPGGAAHPHHRQRRASRPQGQDQPPRPGRRAAPLRSRPPARPQAPGPARLLGRGRDRRCTAPSRPPSATGKPVLLLTGASTSPTRKALLADLKTALPTLEHLAWEPALGDGAQEGAMAAFGTPVEHPAPPGQGQGDPLPRRGLPERRGPRGHRRLRGPAPPSGARRRP